jgi:hypothetical protein
MPWEETDQFIRSGHRSPDDFQSDSLRTITISEEEGIKAVIGKPKGKDTTEVQSYLFDKSKDWTVDKAKAWFEQHKESKLKEHVSAILPFQVLEKIVDKPLRIKGIAMTSGISRNFNIYTPEELQNFANKLVSASVYIEHVAVPNAIGKVTKTEWDGENLWYEAEIFEGDIADKIRKGLIQHVSVGADYETLDIVDGQVPHGLHNAELSLVAVPGIPETNVQVLESLQRAKEQQEICIFCGKNPVEFWLGCCSECFATLPIAESKRQELLQKRKTREQQGVDPLVAGEYILGFYQDPGLFLPEHFRTVWLDQPNGILSLMGKSRDDPAKELCQAILFSKAKFDGNSARDWMVLHPSYVVPASASASQAPPRGIENMNEEELKKVVEVQVKVALAEEAKRTAEYAAIKTDSLKYPVEVQQVVEAMIKEGKASAEIKKVLEAEWDTEYINGLPDSAFAVIGEGGQKDDQGKTVPRTLRHLPHHKADGSLDLPHLRNALARMNQIEPANLRDEAKRHLCAHAKESDITSEFCGEQQSTAEEKSPCEKAKEALTERVRVLEAEVVALKSKQDSNAGSSFVKNPPKTISVEEAIKILEGLLPSPAVERSTLGMQRECQEIRREILKLRERMKNG